MKKKTLLLAGGGHADVPLIVAAQALGFHVITSGNLKSDPGHQISDEVCLADYSDPSALLEIAEARKVDAVCPCANDFSALSSAFVAEKLQLPGHDPSSVSRILHHKDDFRKLSETLSLPSPAAFSAASLEEARHLLCQLQFPVIVKPVDLTGGKGVCRVDNPIEYERALTVAFLRGRAGRIVIEEFLEGSHHALSTILKNGRVVFSFADNEIYYFNPFLVGAAEVPTSVDENAIGIVKSSIEKCARELSLTDGIFHVQFIVRRGKPYIIEVCRRPPGDLYIHLVQLATGIKYPEIIVRCFAGIELPPVVPSKKGEVWVRHCIMASKPGRLQTVATSKFIEDHIRERFEWWNEGDMVPDETWQSHKFGILFLKFATAEERDKVMNNINELVCPVIE